MSLRRSAPAGHVLALLILLMVVGGASAAQAGSRAASVAVPSRQASDDGTRSGGNCAPRDYQPKKLHYFDLLFRNPSGIVPACQRSLGGACDSNRRCCPPLACNSGGTCE